jgi:phosphoribosyl-AMP cyclohydrolase / phosphoribosyl-ATP pyrophosphohydrolase
MEGPACHTGETTCFGALDDDPGSRVLDELWAGLEDRDRERPEGSWTTRLLDDENLRLKKLGEETVELVTALVRGDERAAEEAADLVYHLMVALKGRRPRLERGSGRPGRSKALKGTRPRRSRCSTSP